MPLTPDEEKIFKLCMPHFSKQPVIFDVGAYKGEYSDFIEKLMPHAQLYLFEPNKNVYYNLAKRYKRSFNVLVGCSDISSMGYYRCIGKIEELGSIYNREIFKEYDGKVQKEFVKCVTIDSFCNKHLIKTIDFLKIDVEGAEYEVLSGCMDMMNSLEISFIQVEYGGTYLDAGYTFKDLIHSVNLMNYFVYELHEDKFELVTEENFKEDYRFQNFLLSYKRLY